jgi:hypothetical protein
MSETMTDPQFDTFLRRLHGKVVSTDVLST